MFFVIAATLFFLGSTAGREIPICGPNEIYETCGTYCPQTCLTVNEPRACPDVCLDGCFCQEGYIKRSENGPCVPLAYCDIVPTCQDNEVFAECGSLCAPTCQDTGLRICSDVCVQECVCVEGYIRSSEGGPCVPKAFCNLESAGNEII